MHQLLGRRLAQISLVEDNGEWRLRLAQRSHQFVFGLGQPARIDDDQRNVDAFEHLARLLDAQGTQLAFIIKTGSIDEHHRAERRQFKRFLHRVGRRARLIGDDRHRLSNQRVHQRRLAAVAATEDADVQP